MPHGFRIDEHKTDEKWHPWKLFKVTLEHNGDPADHCYYKTFKEASVVFPGTTADGDYYQCTWNLVRCSFSLNPKTCSPTPGQSVTLYLKTRHPLPVASRFWFFVTVFQFFDLLFRFFSRKGVPMVPGTGPGKVIGSSVTQSVRAVAAGTSLHEVEVYQLHETVLPYHL